MSIEVKRSYVRHNSEEERKEARRAAVRKYRAKRSTTVEERCHYSIHLEEELRTTRELAQAQSDKIQDLEKRLELVVTSFNDLEKSCVVEEQLQELLKIVENRLDILETRKGLPARITK